jgi:hypothetical protein
MATRRADHLRTDTRFFQRRLFCNPLRLRSLATAQTREVPAWVRWHRPGDCHTVILRSSKHKRPQHSRFDGKKRMLEYIHTEGPGSVGFTLAIIFYFACVATIFLLVTYVILPVVKSFTSQAAAIALSSVIA